MSDSTKTTAETAIETLTELATNTTVDEGVRLEAAKVLIGIAERMDV